MVDNEAKLLVNGREYPMPDTFTLGELADMEKITGQGYDLAKGGVLGTLALLYVAVHREDSSVTLDSIRGLGSDDFEVKEATATVPPATGVPSDAPNESKQTSSGDSSTTSDESVSLLNGTGTLGSDTGAILESAT